MTAITKNLALFAIAWIISWTAACTPTGKPVTAVEFAPAPAASPNKDAESADGSIMKFKAHGNEPSWMVEVNENALIYTTPEIQPGKALAA